MTRGHHIPHGDPVLDRTDEIEFLAPRSDVFGGLSDGFTVIGSDEPEALAFGDVDDAPRPRMATMLAALGLTGLIAVGVVAAAPWSSDPTASPTTQPRPGTSAATPTIPTTDEPDADASVGTPAGDVDLSPSGPGYVIVRPPAGMVVAGAYDQGSAGPPIAHLDIWASPGADRSTGTWLAVSSTSFANDATDVIADASPVDIGGTPGLITSDRDDVVVLTWRPDDRQRISIAAHGMALDRLLAYASTISLAFEDQPTYLSAPTADDGTPLERVVDTMSDTADLAGQVAQLAERISFYADRSGATSIVVGTRAARDTDATIARFLLATATGSDGAAVDRVVTVNGWQVTVGSLPLSPRVNVLQWQVDGDWVTVIGTVPVDRLVRSLRTARLATDDEWDAMVDQALDPNPEDDAATPAFATIGSGSDDGTTGWGAVLSEEAGYFVLRGQDFYYSENVDPDPLVPIRTFRSLDTTFVLALVDAAPPGAVLTVTPVTDPNADPNAVPLVARLVTVPGGTWAGAVIAFPGGGEFTATVTSP